MNFLIFSIITAQWDSSCKIIFTKTFLESILSKLIRNLNFKLFASFLFKFMLATQRIIKKNNKYKKKIWDLKAFFRENSISKISRLL